jgi:hypothetical protein
MRDLVMHPDRNPLRNLPRIVRFQYLLILSYIWSVVFTIWVGSTLVLGPTIAGHSVLLVAIFFTSGIFRHARSHAANHRDAMRDARDGTVLYDDLWGGQRDLSAQGN